jgi:hypothetical protein
MNSRQPSLIQTVPVAAGGREMEIGVIDAESEKTPPKLQGGAWVIEAKSSECVDDPERNLEVRR